jgi:hypothetical protein
VAGGAAVVIAMAAVAAWSGQAGSQGVPTNCPTAQRDAVLRTEKQQVLALLGPLRTLRNVADIVKLAKVGYFYDTHQFVSFEGLGVIWIDPKDIERPGHPGFVFYRPAPSPDPAAPRTPRFPYHLIGWGYNGQGYQPGIIPKIVPCMGAGDWFIHERSVHPYSTGINVPMPPAEAWHGQSPGTFFDPPPMQPMIGYVHPRVWTLHIWLDPGGGLPQPAMFDPFNPPPGFNDTGTASFFFPTHPPTH